MGQTFKDLLKQLVEAREEPFRHEPDRAEARLESIESVLQGVLEKLCDLEIDIEDALPTRE